MKRILSFIATVILLFTLAQDALADCYHQCEERASDCAIGCELGGGSQWACFVNCERLACFCRANCDQVAPQCDAAFFERFKVYATPMGVVVYDSLLRWVYVIKRKA